MKVTGAANLKGESFEDFEMDFLQTVSLKMLN